MEPRGHWYNQKNLEMEGPEALGVRGKLCYSTPTTNFWPQILCAVPGTRCAVPLSLFATSLSNALPPLQNRLHMQPHTRQYTCVKQCVCAQPVCHVHAGCQQLNVTSVECAGDCRLIHVCAIHRQHCLPRHVSYTNKAKCFIGYPLPIKAVKAVSAR